MPTKTNRITRNIACLFVLSACAALPMRALADAPAPAAQGPRIVARLQPYVDSHALAGAVTLVASKDKVLDVEAVGFADIAANKPMAADDLFWIASMSKPMTAAAMMMVVDEGKVKLDDPVETYLPEFHGQMVAVYTDDDVVVLKKPTHPITVREVLSHTSGLPFGSRVEPRIDTHPLSVAVMSYALTPLKTQPFTKYSYANAGINTAGRIIEVVSGMPYEEFMKHRLFEPLGMTDTTFIPTEAQIARIAKSYHPNDAKDNLVEIPVGQLTYPLNAPGRYPCPAGGLFSTAADTAKFGQLILNGGVFEGKRLISQASLREMTSTQTGTLSDPAGEHGYGFGLQTTHKIHSDKDPVPNGEVGHGGAYSTNLTIDPEHGLVLVYMVQHAGYAGPDGGKILPTFKRAALQTFGGEEKAK